MRNFWGIILIILLDSSKIAWELPLETLKIEYFHYRKSQSIEEKLEKPSTKSFKSLKTKSENNRRKLLELWPHKNACKKCSNEQSNRFLIYFLTWFAYKETSCYWMCLLSAISTWQYLIELWRLCGEDISMWTEIEYKNIFPQERHLNVLKMIRKAKKFLFLLRRIS